MSTVRNVALRLRFPLERRQISYEHMQEMLSLLQLHHIPLNSSVTNKGLFNYVDNQPAWKATPSLDKLLNIKKGDEFNAYHTQYRRFLRSYPDLHYVHFIGERKNKNRKGKSSSSQYFGLIYFFVKEQEARSELSDLVRQQNSNL